MQNNSNVENEEIEIQLLPLLKALLENLKLIFVIVILFAAGAFLITKFFVTPTYRTNFAVYVNNRNETEKQTAVTSSDITAAKSLAKTYAEVIKSRYVLTQAGKDAGLDYSYKELADMISAETSGDTEIISVYVVSTDPKEAMELAKCIAKVSQSRIAQIIEGCSMAIVDEAYYPTDIYTPSYVKNTAIGGMIGL